MSERPCPSCGAETEWEPDCPGWTQQNREGSRIVMVCQGCGNADLYRCASEECAWWYRDPSIRNNAGMGERPAWLPQLQQAAP